MIFRVVVQSLSSVWLFVIPWTAACQASLSFTLSLGLLKLMFFESVMPCTISSSIAFSSFSQSFPASGSFPMSQLFTLGGQIIGASASASVFPLNIQGWFPLWLTYLISLLSKGLSWVFSSTTVWKDQFVGAQSSLWSSSLEKNIALAIWIIVGKVMSLCVFFFLFIFSLKDSCFTEFCCFLSNLTWISHRYTYILSFLNLPSISLPIPPLQVDTEPLFEFPEPYSKFPLAIYFTYGNVSFHVTLSMRLTLSSPCP